MIIKKYLYMAVFSLGLIAQGISANPFKNAARVALRRATIAAQQEATSLAKPFKQDIHAFTAIYPKISQKVFQPTEKRFTKYVSNQETRKKIGLKCFEYAITLPGMALAASGNAELAVLIAAECLNYGRWGLATGLALVGGSGYCVASQFVRKKTMKTIKDTIKHPKEGFDEACGGGINSYSV